jgi:hypothetical protein|tara:strand:- start:303 stop:497 length:195 start_codon:yes stop_codon:yes gene_type:complete
MIVTQANKYETTNENGNKVERIVAIIDGQEKHIPLNTKNRHYRAVLRWVDAGNTIGTHTFPTDE